MAEKLRARVVRVKGDRHGGALAVAAAIGDQTLKLRDAGDFDAPGTLQVDDDAGTLLDYTAVSLVEDTDPSDLTSPDTITLLSPLAAAIAVETAVFVYEAPDETSDADEETQVAEVWAVCIPEDDDDAPETGEPVEAIVPPHLQDDLPLGTQTGSGVPVVLEWDDDVEEWHVARFRGKGARGVRFEADDFHLITAGELASGAAVVNLTHKPIGESVVAFWGLLPQPPTEYDVDAVAQTVTWSLTGAEQVGDRLWVHYAYRRGLAQKDDLPIPLSSPGWSYLQVGIADAVDRSAVDFDDGAWDVGSTPFGWSEADGSSTPGWTFWSTQTALWLRRTIATRANEAVTIAGSIDNIVAIYWNGSLVFTADHSGSTQTPFTVTVPAGDVLSRNTLAIRAQDDTFHYSPDGAYINVSVEKA